MNSAPSERFGVVSSIAPLAGLVRGAPMLVIGSGMFRSPVMRAASTSPRQPVMFTSMSGHGGQSFITSQLDKLRALRRRIDTTGRAIDLEVDGGINAETARAAIAAGADVLVAGTATFSGGASAYAANIKRLRGDGAAPKGG